MQQRIINRVEGDPHYRNYLNSFDQIPDDTPTEALIVAARQISQSIQAKCIATFSLRGSTVLKASKFRPTTPIMAICPFVEKARQLTLAWGVYPDLPTTQFGFNGIVDYDDNEGDDEETGMTADGLPTNDLDLVMRNACRAALKKGLVNDANDAIVVTAGLPFNSPGVANMLRITCPSDFR